MKKLTILTIMLCIGSLAIAQESKETEFELSFGDTVVWKPFSNCDMIGYNISGPKVISFKPIKFGDRIQIIAKEAGESRIVATCRDNGTTAEAVITVKKPYEAPPMAGKKPEKPATQTFSGHYSFNPPATNFFVTIYNPESNSRETYVKIGDIEAFNDGQGLDRYWNIKNGENWYYRPEAQGWTDDVKWEFQPFGTSFFPLNAFANEVDHSNLSNYYVGNEKLTVGGSNKPFELDCWKFFVEQPDGNVVQYWVDPANGCTLKRQVNYDAPREVTVYDLKYTRLYFGPTFKKGLHDTTR